MEWSDQQAVFNFLYDSVTLTVVFGPPIGESQNGRFVFYAFAVLENRDLKCPYL